MARAPQRSRARSGARSYPRPTGPAYRGGLINRITWIGDSHANDHTQYDLISQRIAGSYMAEGYPVRTFAYPGDTADTIVDNVADESFGADIVVCCMGRNNPGANSGLNPDASQRAAIVAKVVELKNRVSSGRFIFVGIPHLAIHTDLATLNTEIQAVVDHYIAPPSLNTYNGGDNIHLSEQGAMVREDDVEQYIFDQGWLTPVNSQLPASASTRSLYIPNAGHVSLGTAVAPLDLDHDSDRVTLVMRVKTSDTSAMFFADGAATSSAAMLLGTLSGNAYGSAGGAFINSAISVATGGWLLVAIVIGKPPFNDAGTSTGQTYVEGSGYTTAGVTTGTQDSASEARFGSRSDGTYQLDGRIYMPMVFKGKRLTSAQLDEMVADGPVAPSAMRHAPDLLWMFDDASGSSFPEWSGRVNGTGSSLDDTDLSTDVPT